MLRGSKSPGSAYEWSSSENCFRITDEAFLPETSEAALAGVLQHFADMGTIAVKYVLCAQASSHCIPSTWK